MKRSPVERIAKTFHLRDLTKPELLDDTFDFLVRLVVWRQKQSKNPIAEHDVILLQRNEDPLTRLTLILYLALYDPYFFELTKRMAVVELLKPKTPERYVLLIAAQLLAMSPPKNRKPMRTIHAMMVMAIAVKNAQGYRPYGNTSDQLGSIRLLEAALDSNKRDEKAFDKLESVWKERETKLSNLDFEQDEIFRFLNETSPMQSYSD